MTLVSPVKRQPLAQFGASNCWTTAGCWPLAAGLFKQLGPPQGFAIRPDSTVIIQASSARVVRLFLQCPVMLPLCSPTLTR